MRKATLALRKPLPTGVVIGPFRPTFVSRIDCDDLFGQDGAVLFQHGQPGVVHVPVELDAGRFEHAAGGFGNFRSGAVTGDQRHVVRHCKAPPEQYMISLRANRRSRADSERGAKSSQKKQRRRSLNLGLYSAAWGHATSRLNLPPRPADVSRGRQPDADIAVGTGAFVRRRAARGHPPAVES